RERVSPRLGRNHLLPAHRVDIDDIDYPGVGDRHVEPARLWLQEDHVRRAAEANVATRAPGCGVDCNQNTSIAGAQQPPGHRIEIESVRTFRWDLVLARDPGWIAGI